MIRSMITLFLFRIKFQMPHALDSARTGKSDPSQEERVYIDELTGTLQNFDGTHLTISSNGETYVFDVSQTRLECKYGVVFSDQVSMIYQGQLSRNRYRAPFPPSK